MKYTFSFLHILFAAISYSQPDLKFVRYTTEHGLPNNDVFSVFQDNDGYMWFGTKEGCVRFDGIKFDQFQDKVSNTGFPTGRITSFAQNEKDRIWISELGFGCGLSYYDYISGEFLNVCENETQFAPIEFHLQRVGILWIRLNDKNISKYFINSGKFENFIFPKNIKTLNKDSWITSIIEDKHGDVWFGCNGLVKLNSKDSTYIYFNHLKNGETKNDIRYLLEDKDGYIWIAHQNDYISKFTPRGEVSGRFERFVLEPEKKSGLLTIEINTIYEDLSGEIWVGTSNGIYLLNKSTKKFYNYTYDETNATSINDNAIRQFCCDKSGNIWVATRLGVGKIQQKKFKSFAYSSKGQTVSDNKIECLYEDANKNIWIGTPNGIDIFNRNENKFEFLLGKQREDNKLTGSPVDFKEQGTEGMWIGTWYAGLNYYDYKSEILTNVYVDGYSNQFIFTLFTDKKNNLWIGTSGSGLYLYDSKTKEFDSFTKVGNCTRSLSSNRITTILEDNNDNLWVGTDLGLNLLTNVKNKRFRRFLSKTIGDKKTDYINCMVVDKNNFLWIGTNNGLLKYNKSADKFIRFDYHDGLPSNKINSLLADDNNNLWAGTNRGLAKFTPPTKTVKAKVRIYTKEDGLPDLDFLDRSCCQLSDGFLAYGTSKGFFMFHPDSINDVSIAPPVVITGLKIDNKQVYAHQEINGQVILSKSLNRTQSIELFHSNRDFSIQFAALDFKTPKSIKYSYKLEGYSNTWHYTDAQNRQANFTNLDGGSYIFYVKATNSDGVWSIKPTLLSIYIRPPWWKTWWFRILIIVSLVVATYFIMEIRLFILKKQKAELTVKVEERTRDILNQKEEIEFQRDRIQEKNEILEINKTKIQSQAAKIQEMYKLLKKHNIELKQDVKKLSTAMVMQKVLTFEEFIQIYPDDNACYKFLEDLKWSKGFICKKCGYTGYSKEEDTLRRRCGKCRFIESLTSGTIFNRLRISIHKAFFILILTSTGRELNISRLSKTLSLRITTCWDFHNKIKKMMHTRKKSRNKKGGWQELILINTTDKSK